ncbi:MAG: glycosyltransferase family 2 protein [Actinobacteria bacterium]|nr:glycosyltransferase family 2 protein [Actinomycetota bacterium]
MRKDYSDEKVTLVIPNHNGGQYLHLCLVSISRLNYPKSKLEVMIVDNGSSDGSHLEALRLFDFVKVIALDRNMGFSFAVNMGVRRAKADFVGVINSDAELAPDWLNELQFTLENRPQAFAVAPKVLFKDLCDGRRLINSCGATITRRAYACDRFFRIPEESVELAEEEVFSAPATAILMRKDVISEVGFFDDDYFAYYEDVDLMWRARLMGYKIFFNPRAIVVHAHAPVLGEWSYDFAKNVALNRLRTIFKNGWTLLVLTSMLEYMAAFLLDFVKLIFMGVVDRRSAQLKMIKMRCGVIREFCRSMRPLLVKRREIRSRRKVSDQSIKTWMVRTPLDWK